MKTTGIIRNIDELGRLVLPKELRRHFDIEYDTAVEITSEDDKIVIKKFNPRCIFCNGSSDDAPLVEFKGKKLCPACLDAISALR